VFHRWRYPAALATAIGIAFPALALAAGPDAKQAKTKAKHGRQQERHSYSSALDRPAANLRSTIQVQVKQIRAEQRKKRHDRWRPLPGSVSQSTLDAIGSCESGGDPNAVSSGGTYRGKYQFDYGTWASVGGHGDPAAASEKEQDYRAALLYNRSGSSPWPNCA